MMPSSMGYADNSSLQFPFNNSCNENSMYKNLNMAGLRLEVGRDTNRHVRKGLPPSMASFPGEAEIKYYVKATVARPQFYKENYRSVCNRPMWMGLAARLHERNLFTKLETNI